MAEDSLDQLYMRHVRTLSQRADQALAATGFDALVINAGAPPVQFLDDQDYPFKVNPQFKAWVPVLDNPRCVLVYSPGSRPKVLFHRPDDYWHKPADMPQGGWSEAIDWEPMPDPSQAPAAWAGLGKVALIGPGEANPPGLLARLNYDRAVKTGYEIECLRRASAIGVRGHRAALAAFRRRASEYEAHMAYLQACLQREEEMPYNNIVAYNEHAAVLHYQHLSRAVPAVLRSFLIDAGAQFRGYAADITRTHAAGPGAFADLVTAMDRAQLGLCAEIVSGRDFREVHLTAHRVLGDVLHQAGLIDIPGQAALELGLTGVFFPHGIGHLLGLQVHDVGGVQGAADGGERSRPPGHPYLRLTRLLEPGVVVTVEPGLYFIDSLLAAARSDARGAHIDWAMVDALKPYGGIRIEDNIATTAAGPENLTRDAFAQIAA